MDDIDIEDLIAEEDNVITMTHQGYIKRLPVDTYKSQHRGGKGIVGMQTKEEDFVSTMFVSSTHSYIMLFTNTGRMFRIKAYRIPEASRRKGDGYCQSFGSCSPGRQFQRSFRYASILKGSI